MARVALVVLAWVGVVILGPSPVLADFYDQFDDGWFERDPNDPAYDANDPYWTDPNNAVTFDVDNPDWTFEFVTGDAFATRVSPDGWLEMWAGTSFLPFTFVAATVDDGAMDPATSETYFDDSGSHYVVARTRVPYSDRGEIIVGIHTNLYSWETFGATIEFDEKDLVIANISGADWSQRGSTVLSHLDFTDGFWIIIQVDADGDPNNTRLKAAAWNDSKFAWDGNWIIDINCFDEWDPNTTGPHRYWDQGWCTFIALGAPENGSPDQAHAWFDEIESRWGTFTNVGRSLELIHNKPDYGTVTIDPDLLDDPNGDPNDQSLLRRYTDGTEVVLVAEPAPDRGWQRWRIFDPNYPGDANYAADDTNTVLLLTMDQDYTVEAIFKCGSSVPPFVAMTLLALGLTVALRRLG